MAGIGKYTKGKRFTLKSGNTPAFNMMGSSPYNENTPDGEGDDEEGELEPGEDYSYYDPNPPVPREDPSPETLRYRKDVKAKGSAQAGKNK